MKNYKIITTPTTTRYILESATAGATSAGSVASTEQPVGSIITREADKNKVPQKPRQGPLRPQTGGGKHKDKKRAEKQGDVKHKKPFMENHPDHEVEMAQSDTYQLAKQAAALHKMLMRASEMQGLEGWQQAKITKAADYINAVYKNLAHDVAMDGDIDESNLQELDKPSGTLYIILLRDRTESVRVVGDFGTFPAEVQARASKVGIKDKEGRKERPLKVNFLMTSASQALAELDKALADVDFIGGEKAEFVFKNSAFETDIEDEVKELHDLISSGADERFKNYEEPEVGNEPDPKPKGVDHFVVGPDGKRRRVPIPGKPSSQMGGHAVEQPKTYTYKLQRTDLAPKLRDMGFKFNGNNIILSKQQRDQLLAKMGDKQFGMIFGQGDRFAEAGNERNKRNPTRDFLRRYPVPQDQMVRPVKKPEKKKPEQGVAEGSLETDNMVSHIGQVIQSIYPRGGDKNTYMKLVAQEMPRIVKANPKLFRRAFGMAYDRFFHIDQDDDFDYTDYSMRQGERGMEEGVAGPKQCWPGHRKVGTQPGTGKNAGKRVNDCEKIKKEDTYMESLWDQLNTVVNEKAPPGDKYERMVKHIKKGYAKDGKISDKERSIAYATAWKAKNKAKK